jgi:urease accessory protein
MTLFFHTNISNGLYVDGFMHPISGIDHLLAMISVGIVSTLLLRKHIYLLPLAFVSSMLVGGVIGYMQLPYYFTELIICISVLVLGVCIYKVSHNSNPYLIYFITILFGSAHGYAHGIEMPYAAQPIHYFLGFGTATILIHVIGIFIGLFFESSDGVLTKRVVGSSIALTGGYLMVHYLVA